MISLDGLLNVPGLAKIANFYFHDFLHSAFHLVFVVAIANLIFLLQSLWMAWNLTCWCILTTSELTKFGSSSVDFPHFDLVKQARIATSGHFLENAKEEWSELWHADVSWPPSELIKFSLWCVDFPNFGIILTLKNRSNLGLMAIFVRMPGSNGLKFNMQMHPDSIFNCLHISHGLSIFVILTVFWLSETSQICSFVAFSWECTGEIGWTNLVISEEMEKTTLGILKSSSHRARGIPDCSVVRLF